MDTIIVVPCYNEASRLDVSAFVEYADSRPDVAFLYVDDGSSDGTADVLRRLAALAPETFMVLPLPKNVGKGEAVRHGVLAALEKEPRLVGYWDADLSTPLDEIDRLREVLLSRPDLWLAMGSRVQRLGADIRRNTVRHYLGRVFATLASLAIGARVYDSQCGAKLFRVCEEVRDAFARPFRSRWVFDLELLARLFSAPRCKSSGHPQERIIEVPLGVWHDRHGSKLTVSDAVFAFWDVVWIGLERRRTMVRGSGET